jgi:1-deoxy-D-xylulose 5-phosphate reductoisomerase
LEPDRFRQIHRIIAATMQDTAAPSGEVGEILEVDRWAREKAWALINGNQRR